MEDIFGSPEFFVNLAGGLRVPVFGMSGVRKQRGKKAAASRVTNQLAASEWAATASERPYSLADLVDAGPASPAYRYFDGLSLADTKKECAMHGLPITGAKYKLFASLLQHARTSKFGNPKRGEFGEGTPPPPALKANESDKVRRALVADLRKGLVFDKKFKKGANKMLSAQYGNCSAELFRSLFPHSAGKKKVALELEHLQIDRLGKPLRYGGSLEHIPGSLSAQFDEAAGTIKVSGKYTMV